jgi:serine/threonine protein kinase
MDTSLAQDAPRRRLVGRYQLVSLVVSGALGDLWRAKIASGPEEGRVVLVRLIPRTSAADAKAVERLTNAGFAAMELRHAKIAAVLDVVVADSEIAIVSEHIAGAALQSVGRQTGPKRVHATPAIALRIVADMLEAVDAVRAPWAELTGDPSSEDERILASGIHGGLIPDDLLIATFGETMLLESGLAGVAMTLPAISDHPEVVAYRAPEQIELKGTIDERADIFTAAVIAWELLVGRSLFGPMLLPRPPGPGGPAKTKPLAEAAQTSSVKRKVLSAPIQRLDTLPLLKGKVTKALSSWVARCLERDRDARYQTIREALTELYAQGPEAIAPVEDVAKWIVASGVPLDLIPDAVDSESGPASNRPTTPPLEDTRRGVANAEAPRKAKALDISKLTVESLMPSDSVPPPRGEAESVPPSSVDVESMPPSSADVESLPPTSVDAPTLPPLAPPSAAVSAPGSVPVPSEVTLVESVPPTSVDAPTLPPLAPPSAAVSALGSLPVPSEVTLAESVPPFSTEATMLSRVTAAEGGAMGVAESRGPVIAEEPTSAPVVRGVAVIAEPTREDEPAARGAARRASGRKVVTYVVGGAALLVVVGGLRAIFSGPETSAPDTPASAAATASAAPPSGVSQDEPRAEPTTPPPSPIATALPTSAPLPSGAAPGPGPAIDSAAKANPSAKKVVGPKKKPYRPTGI